MANLRDTCLHIRVKDHTNVMYVRRNLLDMPVLRDTCLHIQVNDHTSVISAKRNLFNMPILRHTCLRIQTKDHTNVIFVGRGLLNVADLRCICLGIVKVAVLRNTCNRHYISHHLHMYLLLSLSSADPHFKCLHSYDSCEFESLSQF